MPAGDTKVVAITGASGGIGEATAALLAANGARVLLGARRGEQLHAATARITAAGGEAAWSIVDVTRRADVVAFVASAVRRWGRLDVLVSNAGIGPISPLDDLRVDEWDRMIDVTNADVHTQIADAKARIAMPPAAVARAVAFAIDQPPDVELGEIIVRPTAQS